MCVERKNGSVYRAMERGNRNAHERIEMKGEKEREKERKRKGEKVGGQRRGITKDVSKPE